MLTRIQIVGVPESELYDTLTAELQAGDTFMQMGTVRKNSATFGHVRYDSTMDVFRGVGDVVLVHVEPGSHDEYGSLMLGSFLGFVCRHLADSIYTVSIQFD